jgi:hypothetical protein
VEAGDQHGRLGQFLCHLERANDNRRRAIADRTEIVQVQWIG